MGHGIQVFNPNGTLQFDADARLMRTLVLVTTGVTDGSVIVPGGQGTVTVVMKPKVTNKATPSLSLSGNVVEWKWRAMPADLRGDTDMMISVY